MKNKMQSRLPVASALLASALLLPVLATADGDTERGRELADTCMGCHAIKNYRNTYPMYKVPKLGGQNEEYIVLALKAYRDRERPHKTMHAQAATMSDQDMADIAAYMANQYEE